MTTSKERSLEALLRVYNQPVIFVKEFMGVNPEPWQEQFLNNVARNDRVAVRSGHGVGKTAALAWLGLWFLLTRFPVAIVVTAPSAAQIDNGFWPQLRAWHRRLPPEFQRLIEITSDRATLVDAIGESFLVARTSSKEKPEALQGIHQENTLLIIDEASGVDELVFETAGGSLSTKGAKIVMCSNPTRTSGYFFDAFHRNSHLWTLQKVSALDSRFSSQGPMIAEWEAKKDIQPNGYKVRVCGDFPDTETDVLIPRTLVEQAIDRTKERIDMRLPDGTSIEIPNDDFVEPSSEGPIIWGLDVARMGDDACALAKRRGNSLLEPIVTWGKRDLMHTCGVITNAFNETTPDTRPDEIYIDVIGMGSGVYDRLKELGLPVREVNVALAPFEHNRFLKLRDELWHRTREWFEKGTARIPNQPDLVAELCTPSFKIESSGKIKVEGKSEMKARGYRSPNMADALNLTMMNLNTTKFRYAPLVYQIPDSYFV